MAYRSFHAIGVVGKFRGLICSCSRSLVSLGLLALFFFAPHIVALQGQEVSFTPRYDAHSIYDEGDQGARVPTQPSKIAHPRKTAYSFAQLGAVFKDLCEALRRDQRDQRVYEVSAQGLKEELQCSACRALYRQFQQACRPKAEPVKKVKKNTSPIPTPTPADVGEPEQVEQSEQADPAASETDSDQETQDAEAVENRDGDNPSEDGGDTGLDSSEEAGQSVTPTPTVTPTATPTPTPQPARYPNTELIDSSSRVSAALYEMDPEFGDILKAVQNFSQRLLSAQGITKAESDYYGIISAYLVSAWEGRPGSPLDPKVQAKQDVSELFQ